MVDRSLKNDANGSIRYGIYKNTGSATSAMHPPMERVPAVGPKVRTLRVRQRPEKVIQKIQRRGPRPRQTGTEKTRGSAIHESDVFHCATHPVTTPKTNSAEPPPCRKRPSHLQPRAPETMDRPRAALAASGVASTTTSSPPDPSASTSR